MKKLLISVIVLLGLFALTSFVALPLLGLSATDVIANIAVGTGMGAKLACSGRYLTGLGEAQLAQDLTSYTPATSLLSVAYDDPARSVRVSLLGLSPTVARFRDGLGCTLEIGDTTALDDIVVPRAPMPAGAWPRGAQVDTIDPQVQTALDGVMRRDNKLGLQTRALLVVHAGRVVAESYAEGFTAETPLLGWSMAKSLSAIVFGHLEMLGGVAPDETGLFAQWQSDGRRKINVEHLLRMSSGLDFAEVYAPGSDATRMLFTAHSASDVALASPAAYEPGTHFAYSSGTTNMLMRLMVDRLGGTQAAVDFLLERIFAPLGMRQAVVELDPSGVFVGSSYVYAPARDWARLGQLMLNKGVLNDTRIVTEDWVARAVTPNSSRNDPRYGYQFWLNGGGSELRWPSLPADAYAMSGNRHQSVMIVPSRAAVLVRLGWTSGSYPLDKNAAELLATLASR